MYLYHYTSEDGLQSILRQRVVLVSGVQRKDTHYRYGSGVYLTARPPHKGRERILRNNRDGASRNPDFILKTDCYVKIDKKDLPSAQKIKVLAGKRNIWLNQNEINLDLISFYSGHTETGEEKFYSQSVNYVVAESQGANSAFRQASPNSAFRQASPNHTLSIPDFVSVFGTDDDEEDCYRYTTTTSPSRPSQQQQQEGSGFGTVVAGAAATIAVGAAVYGLFSAFRQTNNKK